MARTRRSIRKYRQKRVPEELIQELLEAARLAPSGCNVQPWKYTILAEKTYIHDLQKENIFWQEFVYDAPLLIIGSGDPNIYLCPLNQKTLNNQIRDGIQPKDAAQRIEALFKGNELARLSRDVSISMTYMMLRAYELGLGTCPVGCFHRERLKEYLGIAKELVPVLALAVGYPDEIPDPTPRKEISKIIT